MKPYTDIFRLAGDIEDPVKRVRFINKQILRRHEGFWRYYYRLVIGWFS